MQFLITSTRLLLTVIFTSILAENLSDSKTQPELSNVSLLINHVLVAAGNETDLDSKLSLKSPDDSTQLQNGLRIKCISSSGQVDTGGKCRNVRRRRGIKTRGGVLRPKGHGGASAGDRTSPRRGKNKNAKGLGEDDLTFGVMACPDLDNEFMQVEVITKGEDENNTYSIGAVAKVSCTPGFGMNLNNETVKCEKGRWRPKVPQCSALPCKVPHIAKGTFYVGSKPLFFEEYKPHDRKIELRCSKGYKIKGSSKLHCTYGEWHVESVPECIEAGCRLPVIEKGMYLQNYRADMIVASGTETDHICNEQYQKPYPSSSTTCDHGEWKPTEPTCILSSHFQQQNFSLEDHLPPVGRSCGNPPQEKLAIAYTEGTPLEFVASQRFSHGTDVMYRCVIIRPKTKNRWKVTCDDGEWIKSTMANNVTCEENITSAEIEEAHEVTHLINSSCMYKRTDTNVVTFLGEQQEITSEQIEFPFGTVLTARCVDIGKFQMKGARRRKCISGQWLGLSPKCDGLSQHHDYGVDKSPTILFRYTNGSIAQTVDSKLIVYPGTTLHMECLYLRKFGRPSWKVSHDHRTYEEGWTEGIENRDPSLEYRLTIDNASTIDNGIYSCATPTRHSHQIEIVVKRVDCPPLPPREDLIYSTSSTAAGTRVSFECKGNYSLVGNTDVTCQSSASWTRELPRCENIECPDISIVPAMAPLQSPSVGMNGTLKKNETAPPKITVLGRGVGGKATFSCSQGFVVDGKHESTCQISGQWSDAVPLCREVECQPPPKPENGYIVGKPPFKAGDIAQVECNQGFVLDGQPIIACQDNARWSRQNSKCAQACTYPGRTIGGTIPSMKFYYRIGETVDFDCTAGYTLVGEKTLRCLETAKWSKDIPNCIPNSR